ncbi:MAG: methionyl-tRNA formyltransferase [Coxiella sp. (in: Bacteria)]|nr:MAG: methionyl-tRNA formyltransferase [Coxiella sp. (in: g-proteobacteria)]
MKIIFAGTPDFAVPSLECLLKSDHEIIAVYTQPDRPAGRGRKLTASAVKQLALQHDIPVYQPATLRNEDAQAELRALAPEVMAVVAYGLLLPQAVLDIPKLGCVNVHPSLLPRWRGAAPIQRTILAGDKKTAVATMQLDIGMDTGPILLLEEVDVLPLETSSALHDRAAKIGGTLLVKTFDLMAQSAITPTPQSTEGIAHAAKVTKAEAKIDWTKAAIQLQHDVCGYNSWPVAHSTYNEATLRIWEAQQIDMQTSETPGTVIAATKDGIDVATGDGVLRVLRLQLPGGKPLTAAEFMNREQGVLQTLIFGL